MTEVLQPLVSSHARRPQESTENLARSLDDHLERYLNLLNEYQKLQQDLNKHLSNGYISLAQANFSNPNRVRYGQDYYDDRMQASTYVIIESASPCFKAMTSTTANYSITYDNEKQEPLQPSNNTGPQDPSVTPQDAEKDLKIIRDPLHWFGILVPPALRASQNHFKFAAIENIPALASLTKELREMEIEVRRGRKKLKKAS